MIITQTPLRISFFGGGTDFREYYLQEGGCVLSTAIDKYIHVILKERFDDKIRVGYTRTELVDSLDQIEHELAREALRKTGVHKRVEIATMGDIPGHGSGLGSSSTVTVGLLNALYTYLGRPQTVEVLARQACEIEIDVLGKPIGVQDQYIAAFGGQRLITFHPNGAIDVESLHLDAQVNQQLSASLMLFYTNIARKAESVLAEQVQNINDRLPVLRAMKDMAVAARRTLELGNLDEFGALLHQGWLYKQQLASLVGNAGLNGIYESALRAGALGGKITGAGGGGFMLLYCPPERQHNVRTALHGLPELPFSFERDGTKVILNYRR